MFSLKTRDLLQRLLVDDVLPNHLPDVKYLLKYLSGDSRNTKKVKDPILLTLGETWELTPRQLIEALITEHTEDHGYQLSMFGLPEFRQSLKRYIEKSERFTCGDRLEVAVNWTGTRSAMYDYGLYLLDQFKETKNTPYFISTDPGWDYEGVFQPLGYQVKYVKLYPDHHFHPLLEEFDRVIQEIKKLPNAYLAFIVINAQHNPTGNNWNVSIVQEILKLAAKEGCGVLIDNAYYGYTQYEEKTSPLQIVTKTWNILSSSGVTDLIFATRSLGKQFHCNGWAIGAITATPKTLDILVNQYRTIHSYNYHAVYQRAMNQWINSSSMNLFLENQHIEKNKKDEYLFRFLLNEIKIPENRFHVGKYAPYLLMEIPHCYHSRSVSHFIRDLFFTTGVLISSCWALPTKITKQTHLPYIRMYTGVPYEKLKEALKRLKASQLF